MLIKSFLEFGAGFISFLTPCVLPIIPVYISYITGKSLNEIEQNKKIVLFKNHFLFFKYTRWQKKDPCFYNRGLYNKLNKV